MAKDSYWFRHDSSAGRGTRMRKMAFIYGHWGKGIYWDVMEILRDQDGYRLEMDDLSIQMLADLIGCKDPDKLFNWVQDCIKIDLLQCDEKYFFSAVLFGNMAKWETTKDAGIQSGIKRNERNRERNANGLVNETRTKREHKITVDNKENITKESNRENLTENLLNDLENSTHLEVISKRSGLTLDEIKQKIPEFKKGASLEYLKPMDMVNHFLRWLNSKKTDASKKEYSLVATDGTKFRNYFTESEIEIKLKSGYWKLC